MGNVLVRWTLRLMAGAMLYPLMQFVVLPMIAKDRIQPRGQVTSAWADVTKQLSGSKTSGSFPASSLSKMNRPTAQRSQGGASRSNEKARGAGEPTMSVPSFLKTGKSAPFDPSVLTSNGSANRKPSVR